MARMWRNLAYAAVRHQCCETLCTRNRGEILA